MKIEKGCRVLISKKCPNTKSTVGTNSRMEKMMGQILPVWGIKSDKFAYIKEPNTSVRWAWSIKDLKLIKAKKIKIDAVLFDPDNLV